MPLLCSCGWNENMTFAFRSSRHSLLNVHFFQPPPTPTPTLCLLLVAQQIIHLLNGRLHLANAAPSPSVDCCRPSQRRCVKCTVNIDRETARGKPRPCQKREESEGDEGYGGMMEGERERSCLLPRQLSVL